MLINWKECVKIIARTNIYYYKIIAIIYKVFSNFLIKQIKVYSIKIQQNILLFLGKYFYSFLIFF